MRLRSPFWFCLLLVFSLSVLHCDPVYAAEPVSIVNELSEISTTLGEASDLLKQGLSKVESSLENQEKRLERLEEQSAKADEMLQRAERQLAKADESLQRAEEKSLRAEAALKTSEQELKNSTQLVLDLTTSFEDYKKTVNRQTLVLKIGVITLGVLLAVETGFLLFQALK